MTSQLKSNVVSTDTGLVVVRVEDAVDPVLAGRIGLIYESPPQPHPQAMTLVQVLGGCAAEQKGRERWVVPIAGGRRVISLLAEDPCQLRSNSARIGA